MIEKDNMTQKEAIIYQINFMKSTSIEELYLIIQESIATYLKSIFIFGIISRQAKECLNIIKEMIKIIISENKLLSQIKKNIDNIDLDEASDIIDLLNILNEKTYFFYDNIITEVENACSLRDPYRVLRPRNGIDSLITNPEYKDKVNKLIKEKKDV